MAHPHLAFCPYLPVHKPIVFGDWEIGPLAAFTDRWADGKFKQQSEAFLAKFVDVDGKRIEKPSIVCRRNAKIDGTPPTPAEMEALTAAIAFAFLDENPRLTSKTQGNGWSVLTSDNTELHVWPIDVDAGYVVVTTGLMVRNKKGGYRIADDQLIVRPPLDLQAPLGSHSADAMTLEAIYKTVLTSASTPGVNPDADKLKVALEWFTRTWRNTETVSFSERVVYLKTAFESLTGTSASHMSAAALRTLFEGVPDTTPADTDKLLWSPSETPVNARTWTKRDGTQQTDQVTDLEYWFMEFAQARNDIIHKGAAATLNYAGPGTAFHGHFVFTAEFLLRATIKVMLAPFGFPDLWRSAIWRIVKATWDDLEQKEREAAAAGGAAAPASS